MDRAIFFLIDQELLSKIARLALCIYKIFYRFFVQWANQMAFEVSGGKYGKNNRMVKLIKRVGEAISYSVGWISERRTKWQNTK